MIPKGVLSEGDTISVTSTNPHSNTPDTENATKNLKKKHLKGGGVKGPGKILIYYY